MYPKEKSMKDALGYNLGMYLDLPSGKRLHNYGKSPFSMGKSTINCHFQ